MNKETFYKRWCIALAIFSVACVTALTVLVIVWPRTEPVISPNTIPTGEPTGSSSPIGTNQEETLTEDNAESIQTPYATLYFPDEWKSYVTHTSQTNGEASSEAFSATIGGHTAPLYTIHFAAPELGHPAGTVVKDGEEVPVTVELHEFTPDETWTDEDTQILYALQETVNDVLAALLNQ